MSDSSPRKIIFAGGGTGGHLFPGLAIAEQLTLLGGLRREDMLFLCSDRAIDERILKREGVNFAPLPARPFSLRPKGLYRFMRRWGECVRLARGHIRTLRAGGATVTIAAMGGFAAAPVVQAARAEKARILLVNLDAVPGLANRWIARHADPVLSAAKLAAAARARLGAKADRWRIVGPIVRSRAKGSGTPQESRLRLGLDPDRPVLMVTGGSQGASSINDLVRVIAERPGPIRDGRWQILHQCGNEHGVEETLRTTYERTGHCAIVQPFVEAIGDWWAAADLAISRAGAGSVAEAWANRIPTIFMPYPYHKDQHQRHNAEALVEAGGALLATDFIDGPRNLGEIGPALDSLLRDAERRVKMRHALANLGPADGAEIVARDLLGL